MGQLTITISALSITELEGHITDLHRRFQSSSLDHASQAAALDMDPDPATQKRRGGRRPLGTRRADAGLPATASEGAAVEDTADAVDLCGGGDAAPVDEDTAAGAQAEAGEVGGEPEPEASAGGGAGEAEESGVGSEAGSDGEPESLEEDAAPPSVDDLARVGRALAAARGFDAVGTVMSKHGITRMSDCAEDKRAALLADFQEAM